MAGRFFPVKSGFGTATASQDVSVAAAPTGTFASIGAANCYATIEDAIASGKPSNNFTTGDTVICSHLHSQSLAGTSCYFVGAAVGEDIKKVLSVDDSNADQLKAGATLGGRGLFTTANESWYFYGLTIESGWGGSVVWVYQSGVYVHFQSCTFTSTSTSTGMDMFLVSGDASQVIVEDGTFKLNRVDQTVVQISGRAHITFIGGQIDGIGVSPRSFTEGGYSSGGGYVRVLGTDLSNMDSNAASYLVKGAGSARTVDDVIFAQFYNVKLPATFGGAVDETLSQVSSPIRIELIGVSPTNPHVYELHLPEGTVKSVTNHNLNTSTNLQPSTNYSFEVETSSLTSFFQPLRFRLPVKYADLNASASDVLTLEVNSEVSLDGDDLKLYLGYADDADPMIMNFLGSHDAPESGKWAGHQNMLGGFSAEVLSVGGAWTGFTSSNPKVLKVDTSGDAAEVDNALAPYGWVDIYKFTDTNPIYLDTEIGHE